MDSPPTQGAEPSREDLEQAIVALVKEQRRSNRNWQYLSLGLASLSVLISLVALFISIF